MKPLLSSALLFFAAACAAEARVVYHETFPDFRDPGHYTRIAESCSDWKILTEPDGTRFMRVTVAPVPGHPRALVLWDLVPIQFNSFSIEVRIKGTDGAPVYLGSAAMERNGSSFVFKSFGETGSDSKPLPLPADGSWARYEVSIPADLKTIHMEGKEVSPFVHGIGDALSTWEGMDFSNRAFTALFLHPEVPPASPLIGKTFTIDFRLLELRDVAGSSPSQK
ncbi:MAG: hypothetical protein D4R65_05165 [Verrucomicrobiaceae bacterium]|nr:MAG: hypothetical protein D4R65_05165 [Verrucomicrobiaceae bacterium]